MNHLHVVKGDVVKASFYLRAAGDQDRTYKVLEVQDRAGSVNNGRNKTMPLVRGVDVDSGENSYFDISYVTEIVSREKGAYNPLPNIFADRMEGHRFLVNRSKNRWEATFNSLLILALAGVTSVPLKHGIRENAHELYLKDGSPGLIRREDHGYDFNILTVNAKVFRKWVQRNATRLILTQKEADAEATESNNEWERMYWEDVEREWEYEAEREYDPMFGEG